ncbi:hypothetical protein ABH935_004978 [Catenulispora sp. GAS73]
MDSNRPLATSRSSCATSVRICAPAAAVNVRSAAPVTIDTTSSCANVSTPKPYASGIDSNVKNRTRSMPIITGRLRRNSTHGPSGSATSAPAAVPAADRAATSAVPECSTLMRINAKALNASQVPSVLTAYADQSQLNCRPRLRRTFGFDPSAIPARSWESTTSC